jgi:hypothetical protein
MAYAGPALSAIMGMGKSGGQSAMNAYLNYYLSHPEEDPGFTSTAQFHGDPFKDEALAGNVLSAHLGYNPPPPPVTAPPAALPPIPTAPVITPEQIAAARDAARADILGRISARGLDPNQYNLSSLLDRSLTDLGATDPKNFNGDVKSNILDSILSEAQSNQRSQLLNQVDDKIGTNYGDKQITPSLLDDTITNILGQQRQGAMTQLERGMKRGIYNDVGYNAGLSTLNNEEQAAKAKLGSMGNDVLNKYRTDENTVRDNAYAGASNYNLGRQFNLDDYLNQGSQIADRAKQFAGGDLRNALGGTNLFDFGQLSNNIGSAQGAVNLKDSDVATALAERKRKNSLGRGLGSQGAF